MHVPKGVFCFKGHIKMLKVVQIVEGIIIKMG